MRRGFTLLELLVVLTITGLAVSVGLRAVRVQMDRMAVLGARERLVALFTRARAAAVASGSADLVLDRVTGSAWIDTPLGRADSVDLVARYGVRVDPGAARPTISFDALGLGRIASRSIHLERRAASARLVVSSYGRVDRR